MPRKPTAKATPYHKKRGGYLVVCPSCRQEFERIKYWEERCNPCKARSKARGR